MEAVGPMGIFWQLYGHLIAQFLQNYVFLNVSILLFTVKSLSLALIEFNDHLLERSSVENFLD